MTGSADKSVKIWGLDFGDCHKSFHAHDDVVTAVMFMHESEEDVLFWSAGKDGKVGIYLIFPASFFSFIY